MAGAWAWEKREEIGEGRNQWNATKRRLVEEVTVGAYMRERGGAGGEEAGAAALAPWLTGCDGAGAAWMRCDGDGARSLDGIATSCSCAFLLIPVMVSQQYRMCITLASVDVAGTGSRS